LCRLAIRNPEIEGPDIIKGVILVLATDDDKMPICLASHVAATTCYVSASFRVELPPTKSRIKTVRRIKVIIAVPSSENKEPIANSSP